MSFIPVPLSKIINEHRHNDQLACFFHDNRSHLPDCIVLSAPLTIKRKVLPEHKPSLSRRLTITRADICLHFAFRSPTVKHFFSCMRAELDRLREGLTHCVDCVPAIFTTPHLLAPFLLSWPGSYSPTTTTSWQCIPSPA